MSSVSSMMMTMTKSSLSTVSKMSTIASTDQSVTQTTFEITMTSSSPLFNSLSGIVTSSITPLSLSPQPQAQVMGSIWFLYTPYWPSILCYKIVCNCTWLYGQIIKVNRVGRTLIKGSFHIECLLIKYWGSGWLWRHSKENLWAEWFTSKKQRGLLKTRPRTFALVLFKGIDLRQHLFNGL